MAYLTHILSVLWRLGPHTSTNMYSGGLYYIYLIPVRLILGHSISIALHPPTYSTKNVSPLSASCERPIRRLVNFYHNCPARIACWVSSLALLASSLTLLPWLSSCSAFSKIFQCTSGVFIRDLHHGTKYLQVVGSGVDKVGNSALPVPNG